VVHFSIAVSDLEASSRSYTEVLGLKQILYAPDFKMVFLTAGKDHVILCKSETPIQPNPEGQRRVHHVFAVDPSAYDNAKAVLQQNGVAIIDEETARPAFSPAGRCISTIPIATCSGQGILRLQRGQRRSPKALAQDASRTVGTGRRSPIRSSRGMTSCTK
jgi:catechol 2,3-dioxygenase-like lactoylglutathione lyase family enzyme